MSSRTNRDEFSEALDDTEQDSLKKRHSILSVAFSGFLMNELRIMHGLN